MRVLLPSVEVLERFSDKLKSKIGRSSELFSEIWRRVTSLFNVDGKAKHTLPKIEAFYTIESLIDVYFIVGGARSTLPLTWDISNPKLALVEFTRPLVLVNPYVYYIQTLIVKESPYLILVFAHELSHIAFTLGCSTSCVA